MATTQESSLTADSTALTVSSMSLYHRPSFLALNCDVHGLSNKPLEWTGHITVPAYCLFSLPATQGQRWANRQACALHLSGQRSPGTLG
jgi:hypothetical protein